MTDEEKLSQIYKVCEGCQEFFWKKVRENIDLDQLSNETAIIVANEYGSPRLDSDAQLEVFRSATAESVVSLMDHISNTASVILFGMAAQLIINNTIGIAKVEEFTEHLKRAAESTLFEDSDVLSKITKAMEEK